MSSDDEIYTPPGTPPNWRGKSKLKAKRKSLSLSSSSDKTVPKKIRKHGYKFTTKDVIKLVKRVTKDPPSWNNNLNDPFIRRNVNPNLA